MKRLCGCVVVASFPVGKSRDRCYLASHDEKGEKARRPVGPGLHHLRESAAPESEVLAGTPADDLQNWPGKALWQVERGGRRPLSASEGK